MHKSTSVAEAELYLLVDVIKEIINLQASFSLTVYIVKNRSPRKVIFFIEKLKSQQESYCNRLGLLSKIKHETNHFETYRLSA